MLFGQLPKRVADEVETANDDDRAPDEGKRLKGAIDKLRKKLG
ncbi:MAG TPA: hypothetical protein VG125_14725 [Pirellulales bacterium]|jgi:hypothetical protein|nr:hypothetical protein [Pirellulales bacterium]